MEELYTKLSEVFDEAFEQASAGKGKERHASEGVPFEEQPIGTITNYVGLGFPLGQAIKKITESQRLSPDMARAELLGAINYIALAIIKGGE